MTDFKDNFSFRRTVNTPPRSIGEKSLSIFEDFASLRGLTLYDAVDYIKESPLTKKAANSIKAYKSILEDYSKKIKEDSESNGGINIESIFFNFLEDIDYFSIFKSDGEVRMATANDNIKELFRAYYDYKEIENNADINNFLEETSLYRDTYNNENKDAITLMTVHNAKGLEFEVVFMTGMEHSVFPHYFALEEENGIEEERRLFYVAITRAKQKLYLTYSKKRRINTGIMGQLPSSFLSEIPKHLMEIKEKNSYHYNSYIDIDEDAFDY